MGNALRAKGEVCLRLKKGRISDRESRKAGYQLRAQETYFALFCAPSSHKRTLKLKSRLFHGSLCDQFVIISRQFYDQFVIIL